MDARQLGIATQRLELFGPFQSVGGVHRVGPGELSVKPGRLSVGEGSGRYVPNQSYLRSSSLLEEVQG